MCCATDGWLVSAARVQQPASERASDPVKGMDGLTCWSVGVVVLRVEEFAGCLCYRASVLPWMVGTVWWARCDVWRRKASRLCTPKEESRE